MATPPRREHRGREGGRRRISLGAVAELLVDPPPHGGAGAGGAIAWRLGHLSEMLTLRAGHTVGSHVLTHDDYRHHGDAAGAIAAFDTGAAAWREALTSADDAALDTVGRSTYPDGSDPDDAFIETAWWVNQELLHHGAEIALLRDLYRDRQLCCSSANGARPSLNASTSCSEAG